MFVAKNLIGIYYKTDEALLMLVIAYLLILLPISIICTFIERRVRYAGFGGSEYYFKSNNLLRLCQGIWVSLRIALIAMIFSIVLGVH